MPEDLDSAPRKPYAVPSTRRRRIAGWIHLSGAAVLAALVVAGSSPRLLAAAGLLGLLGAWSLASAWEMSVGDRAALEAAGREVTFPVGHASAAVSFDGWRARPVWNVLLFDAAEPPRRRALVRVSAVDGSVVGTFEEVMSHES